MNLTDKIVRNSCYTAYAIIGTWFLTVIALDSADKSEHLVKNAWTVLVLFTLVNSIVVYKTVRNHNKK